jgi:hypothetical protein
VGAADSSPSTAVIAALLAVMIAAVLALGSSYLRARAWR